MHRILIIEDDFSLNNTLAYNLRTAGYTVDSAYNAKEAFEYLKQYHYILLILDINLPDGNGFELYSELKEKSTASIIFLTANDLENDIVKGFDLGADDYVLKPFEMAELEARVRAVLRRADNAAAPVLRCGTLCFDTRSRHAAAGERPIQLSRREGMLLEELLRSSPRVVIKDVLEERLYSFEEEVTPNALEAVASRLRRKLRESGADCRMETVRGLGYRMSPASSEERAGRGRTGGRRI